MTVTVRRPGERERTRGIGEPIQLHPPRRTAAATSPESPPWFDDSHGADGSEASTDAIVRSIVATHELERRRIARDLHDVVGQALTAIRLHLELIRRDAERPATVQLEADEAIELIASALREVRDLSFEIRPSILDDLGLVAAARSLVARQARIAGFVADFRAELPAERLALELEAACFRTLQEALTNVARHAAATRVDVSLAQAGDEIVLTVRDDGVGFVPATTRPGALDRPSLGLLGIWERIAIVGGRLSIDSIPGEGTVVRAAFPAERVGPDEGPPW